MGLDQYLSAKLRTYKPHGKEKQHKIRPLLRKALPEMFRSGNIEYIQVEFEAGYWRKANQIHKWFVDNVQEGEDDCGEYYVSREQLKELLELCKEVIKIAKLKKGKLKAGCTFKDGKEIQRYEDGKIITNPDEVGCLLPTTSGFFFGGTDYDEWYLDDIKRTIKIINKCLKMPEEWGFEYHSSW